MSCWQVRPVKDTQISTTTAGDAIRATVSMYELRVLPRSYDPEPY